jgi:hypothetical protein
MTEPRDHLQIGSAQLQLVRGRRAGAELSHRKN